MSAQLLDGTKIAETIRAEMKAQISAEGLTPCLGIILVGDDPASHVYIALKEKAAAEVGIRVIKSVFEKTTDEQTIISKVRALNADPTVHGILVQLPLPPHLNPNTIIAAMDPNKDVDGFHPENRTGVLPPVVAGTIVLLNKTGDCAGKHAVVVAKSQVFSQTFCDALRERGMLAEPTYAENTELMGKADILITAVGNPAYITPTMVKPGAVVIDVGVSELNGKMVGDVAPEVMTVAGFMTPVPGGVGPMTVAMLLRNTVELCRQQTK